MASRGPNNSLFWNKKETTLRKWSTVLKVVKREDLTQHKEKLFQHKYSEAMEYSQGDCAVSSLEGFLISNCIWPWETQSDPAADPAWTGGSAGNLLSSTPKGLILCFCDVF